MHARHPTKKTLEILGRTMAFHDEGEGTPFLFLHGNPTSSYLWRHVIAELRGAGHLIAPDLIGMGDSDKLPEPGPDTYTFAVHKAHLDALIERLVGPEEKVVLVVHDWGSALGFRWAQEHPDRVLGIAYMEAIVRPYADWAEWNAATPLFQGFRSDAGEEMILDENLFVERILLGSIIRELSDEEKATYRRPYLRREDRWPTLSWPRQLPIAGEPEGIIGLVADYAAWMARNEIPKLFVSAEPGAILTGTVRDFCRAWKNQTEISVPGQHFIQEDNGPEIGRAVRAWAKEHGIIEAA